MITASRPLLLASGSPRRREILETLRVPLRVVAVDCDERLRPGEAPTAYLERIVDDKLAAALALPEAAGAGAVLVADTSVILGDRILGKPVDVGDARAMLRALSGTTHEVWTRFAIAGPDDAERARHLETVCTRVSFRPLTEREVLGYVASGEGRDKAGAYAVQGLGSFMVVRLEGSYPNVVGLPTCEVVVALERLGLLEAFPFEP